MQEKYTYGLWGAVAGAVALAIVGFTWGGWSTSSGAAKQAEAAVPSALIPICAKEVMADPSAVAELKVKRVSDYDDVVRDFSEKARRDHQFGLSVQQGLRQGNRGTDGEGRDQNLRM